MDLTRKIAFFEEGPWFKFNDLGLALCKILKFCTSVATGLKLKARKFWRPNPAFVEVAGEKLVGVAFLAPILNRVKCNLKCTLLCIFMEIAKCIITYTLKCTLRCTP